ncbi:MAG TPA: TerB family tellurite resistance protein [Spirochaetota bacterium]|nr:TerB family tellurite resistance protein [Spirochaetota bacterium]HPJ38232.1 TerB family tellurite resistance protein [Spirochaetota bacterium]HPQ54339.1 TerB family tellurite resistance protein [Spirochaetota bacterium]
MIQSFNKDEKKALIAIMKFVASADGVITGEEITTFNEIAEKKNFDDFQEIFTEVDNEVHTIEDIMELAKKVRTKTHEYDILRYAFEMAIAGTTIEPEEVEILRLLGKEWGVDIKSLLKG